MRQKKPAHVRRAKTHDESRKYARDKIPFATAPFRDAARIFGQWVSPHIYVVYSYGKHWPLHAFDKSLNMWFSNADKYSRSTSKHYSCSKPDPNSKVVSVNEIVHIIQCNDVDRVTREILGYEMWERLRKEANGEAV